jgi:hypothetical protein
MNRRKFLRAFVSLPLAAAAAALAIKARNDGVALNSAAHPTDPLFVGTSDQYSKYLTSKDAWYLPDYPGEMETFYTTSLSEQSLEDICIEINEHIARDPGFVMSIKPTRFSFSYDAKDWRAIYGSSGA